MYKRVGTTLENNFSVATTLLTLLLEDIVFHRELSMIGTLYPMKLYLHLMYLSSVKTKLDIFLYNCRFDFI